MQRKILFIALVLSLIVLAACTMPAPTSPPLPEVSNPLQSTAKAALTAAAQVATDAQALARERKIFEATQTAAAAALPSDAPAAVATAEPLEPASIFADPGLTIDYYAYKWLKQASESGYIEECEVEGADPGAIYICPVKQLLIGDLFVSAAKFFHQDGDFEPIAPTNLSFDDPKLVRHPYAASAEELGRQLILPRHFLCQYPNPHFVCPFQGATRADGAVMIELLAHSDQIVYDDPYRGSALLWSTYERTFPDVAYTFGLKEDEVKAPEALYRDLIFQRRGGSRDFGPEEPLTVEVWAEWLMRLFELYGSPKPVPTPLSP